MRNVNSKRLAALSLPLLAWPMLASAGYMESIDGDLSGDYQNPTPIPLLANGATTLSGTVEGEGAGVSTDLDYFTVTVPTGQRLVSLRVLPDTVGGGALGAFIGLYAGATGVDPATAASTDALGYYFYSVADIDTDILDDMATFNWQDTRPSQGFSPPLAPASYTFWVQEGADGEFPYNFEIKLQSVAEPSTILLMGLAGGLLGMRRRVSVAGRSFSSRGPGGAPSAP
jgi:hypothetical protein